MLLIIEALLLILASLEQDHRAAVAGQIYPLDKALNSVDDQYKGCREKMSHLVQTKYLAKELYNSATFYHSWKSGEKRVKMPVGHLSRSDLIAIYVYTDNSVYQGFKSDSHYGRKQYKYMTYKCYSLNFLLTEAIQKLKTHGCMTTYGGTSKEFDKYVLNKEIGFGSFTSSSLNYKVAQGFGSKSCFEILTCEGAYVAPYSKFPHEQEVLIPPYEKFRVTAVKTKQYNLWCNTVYTLKSIGTKSDLNCAVAYKNTLKY